MYLVQIEENVFINAENIDWLMIDKNEIRFTLKGEANILINVEEKFQQGFVNHLQGLNSNISNIETVFYNHKHNGNLHA